MNRFKQKLRKDEVALGQMVLDCSLPGIGPMLAACGLEFVIYDMEHGRCDIGLVAEMIASCRGTGITPMVRVADLELAPLSRVLDLGAMGVMVPRVETRAQMERIVAELKYPPQGKRGVALGLAHDLYRARRRRVSSAGERGHGGHRDCGNGAGVRESGRDRLRAGPRCCLDGALRSDDIHGHSGAVRSSAVS